MKKTLTVSSVSLITAASIWGAALPVGAAEPIDTKTVVITATRTEQEIKDTPSAVEVITRDDLEKTGATNLATALKMATSIDVGGAGMAGGNISIRGMSTRHTLILVDGKRLVSEGGYTLANTYELQRINMANVERIEIIRGPGSSLYGSDALGGVVNIITRKAEQSELTFSLSPKWYTNKGSVRTDNYSLHYDSGQSDKWAWRVTANREDSDMYANDDGTSKNQFGRREFLNMDATYNLTADQKLDVSATWLWEDLAGRSTASGVGSSLDYYDNKRQEYSIGWRGKTETANYQLRAYYGEHEKNNPSYSAANGLLHNRDFSERKTWLFDGSVSMQLSDQHLLTSGAEYRTEKYSGTRIDPTANSEIDAYAVYVQDEWVASDRLLLIPSLRYDDSDKFAGNFSPKLGATYKLNDNLRIKAGVGRGFKAPTLDDLYMKMSKPMGGMTVNVTGNPDLKPEKSTSYELGIEGERGRSFGKISYFINDVSNLITTDMVRTVIPVPGGQPQIIMDSTYVNKDRADIDGFEVEVGRYLDDNFTVKLNYTYLDAVDATTGSRLSGRARHQGSLQFSYDSKTPNGVSVILWNQWRDSYYHGDDSVTKKPIIKSFAVWNVSVQKQWNDNLSSYIGFENIFDKKVDEFNLFGPMIQVGLTYKM